MGKRIIPEGIDNHLILGSLSAQRLPKAPNNNNSPIINSFYKISSQLSHPTLPPYRISNDSPLLQKYNSESPFPMRIRTDSPDIFEDKSLAKYQATVGRRSLKSREPAYATSLELPSFRVENLKRETSEPRSSKRIDTINQQTHSDFRTSRASINRSISSFVGRNGETSTANVQHQLIKIFPKRKPSAKAESKSQRISQFPKEIYESLKLERQRSSRRSEEDSAVRSYVSIVMSSAINRRNLHLDISENLKIALNRRIDAAFNRVIQSNHIFLVNCIVGEKRQTPSNPREGKYSKNLPIR